METSRYRFFIGVDLDSKPHQACAVDACGELVAEWAFQPDAKSSVYFVNKLLALPGSDTARMAFGVETPQAPLVNILLDKDLYAIDPRQLELLHELRIGKQKHQGALVLAQTLRTDLSRFRFFPIKPQAHATIRPKARPTADRRLQHSKLAPAPHQGGNQDENLLEPKPSRIGKLGFDGSAL
jgi:hypothetical protein